MTFQRGLSSGGGWDFLSLSLSLSASPCVMAEATLAAFDSRETSLSQGFGPGGEPHRFRPEQLNLSQKNICLHGLEFEWGVGGSSWWLRSVTVFILIRWFERRYQCRERSSFHRKCPRFGSLPGSPALHFTVDLTFCFGLENKNKPRDEAILMAPTIFL